MYNKKLVFIIFLWGQLNLNAHSLKYLGLESGVNKEFSCLGKYNALDNKISFSPAVIAEFDFGKRINFRTGINYFKGGFSYNGFTPSKIPINVQSKIHTLNIPILASLPININNRLKLLINCGSNILLATSGVIIEKGFYDLSHTSPWYIKQNSIRFGNDSAKYKRISYGLNLGFGIRLFDFIELNSNYIYGLSDYSNFNIKKNSRKNLSLGIIYYFYRKPTK